MVAMSYPVVRSLRSRTLQTIYQGTTYVRHKHSSPENDRPNAVSTPETEPGVSYKKIARFRPKRDPTIYGIPESKPIPDRAEMEATEENKSHPLWKFFHDQNSINIPHLGKDEAGREWTAAELRKKSFEDLHKLWYLVLMERNALLTEKAEMKRSMRLTAEGFLGVADHISKKLYICRKSMAHIKYVVYERRRAEAEAIEILREEKKAKQSSGVQALEHDGSPLSNADAMKEQTPAPHMQQANVSS